MLKTAVRARLATLNRTQFAALRSVLQQVASAVDIRIAQLDAERAQLTSQKQKLAAALAEFCETCGVGQAPRRDPEGSQVHRTVHWQNSKAKEAKRTGPVG